MNVERRTVLQATGIIAVGGLVAACSSGGSDAAASAGSSAPAGPSTAPGTTASGAPTAGSAAAGAIAQTADIPVGGGVIIADPAVVLTQPTEGDVKAFTAVCPHQGCLVGEVVDNEIICPCHGSRFSATDGSVIQGTAQVPLAAAAVVVENGTVILG